MLLLVSSPRSSCPLIDFVNDIKKGGLYVIGHVKLGNYEAQTTDPTVEEYTQWLSLIDHLKVKAFAELTLAKTVREGTQHLIRISGMGAMKPNTIVMGFYDEENINDFFESDNSAYQTRLFRDGGEEGSLKLFPAREKDETKALSAKEYVAIVSDVLKMKKNICLCRHFHRLDKNVLGKNSSLKYIDIWPLNFFNPKNEDPFDVVSLFMMQLGCILNMLPKWRKLQVRVFLCDTMTA